MIEAVKLLATTEAILLDPVYSGKAFRGMLAELSSGTGGGRLAGLGRVLFIHTGGIYGLFPRADDLFPESRTG
jgi:1-aminocyclopropane-1-carboxylate deaminase/D-cysteine desulfhydrase-like pyridoxal-dependent ACC family enzyme